MSVPEGGEAPKRKVDVSLVVPVFDECEDFAVIVERFGAELKSRGMAYEFIFVFDGVPDYIFQRVTEQKPRNHPVKLINFNQPFGESIALSAGFKVATGDIIVSLPPYLQIDPVDIHKVLDKFDEGCDLVAGWRSPRVDQFLNRLQSISFNLVIRKLAQVNFHDLNCMVKAMRRNVLQEVSIQGDMFRFLPVLAYRAGFRVQEVKVRHLKEEGKTGFFGIGVYLRRFLDVVALLFLTKFTRKPLRFFGITGGFCAVAGLLIIFYLVLMTFTGLGAKPTPLRNQPMLIFAVAMVVLGIQIFSIGLVGEIIIFTQSKNLKEYRVGDVLESKQNEERQA
ncbi:MAG: glycosyltransferase [Planctomycetota bacterium]|jgi:glycosyltransferase involved in cell wall biosynthesis